MGFKCNKFINAVPYTDITVLDKKYIFDKKINDGSASKIFRYFNTEDGKYYVVKRIHKNEEWKNELKILKNINSDKLLKVVDNYESFRNVYIVTEYYKGHDLFDYLDVNIPLDESTSKPIFKEIVDCVNECHKNNIAHLDIKFENFMVVSMNPPKFVLIDFGHSEYIKNSDYDLVKLGYGKYGTTVYLCPEGNNHYFSLKSDVWSLGICLYLMLTGDYPFNGYDDDEYEINVMEYNLDRTYLYNKKKKNKKMLSKDASKLITMCLSKEHSERCVIEDILNSDFLAKK